MGMTTSGESAQTTEDKTLEYCRRQKFWEEMDTAYAALQQDTDAWKAYQDELRSFEGTLMDGLAPSKG